MKKIITIWKDLNKTIYTGTRLKSNLLALTLVSMVCIVLGAVLTVINIVNPTNMLIPAIATTAAGIACALFAGVFKKRSIAAAT